MAVGGPAGSNLAPVGIWYPGIEVVTPSPVAGKRYRGTEKRGRCRDTPLCLPSAQPAAVFGTRADTALLVLGLDPEQRTFDPRSQRSARVRQRIRHVPNPRGEEQVSGSNTSTGMTPENLTAKASVPGSLGLRPGPLQRGAAPVYAAGWPVHWCFSITCLSKLPKVAD